MTTVERTTAPAGDEVREYNRTAIEVAAIINEHRMATFSAEASAGEPGLDQLFPDLNRVPLGVALEYERMGNQPVSDELATRAADLGYRLEHVGLTIGTVVHGIDLRAPSADAIAFVHDVQLERKVVFFRDQHLSEDEQVALGRHFGDLDAFPFAPPGENPFIAEISHGRRRPGTENGWHTDVTWMEQPSLGSIAQLIEAPPSGGNTLFADSHAAFLGLPPALQELIRHLDGTNDYRLFVAPGGRNILPDDLVAEIKERIPFGVVHPLARTHPETGKTALFMNGAFLRPESLVDRRTGESIGEKASKRTVVRLLSEHARPEYQCRFQWSEGDVAFWDNRAVQHYASSDYWPHRRILRRVTVAGDRPYFDADEDARTTPERLLAG